ncbi:coiled-coil domain-containing protein 57 isoform X3 [Eubalaena glacialis]|uniref:coiled-coil domain-containing protein 57 isoform X3 n=1 Tax=Eubalaena glacialis TaxID=27606 RepID=UPI002A59A14D|nr:coiled-coil domain-containing protein 57 isoform X3 [Eubalaena glacialis]
MLPPPTEQALNALLARKEEEWRALQAQHSQMQEAALQDAQRQLEEAQGKLRRLREDFVYNLQVLEERDRELERYDAAFAQARGLEEARQAEVSELKIEVAKLRQALAGEARRVEDLQQQSQQRLQEHRLELERVHSDRNGELDQQREQYGNLKWKLERRLEELDSELALQRQDFPGSPAVKTPRFHCKGHGFDLWSGNWDPACHVELLQEFESEMQKREHAFRLQADSMSNVVLAHELKTKLLNKELVALREAGVKAAESLQSAEAVNAELEDRLQRRDWELRDLAAVKDARIKDLEGKLHSVQLTRKKEEEMFRRKHEELDRLARERDTVLMAVKSAHAEQLQAVEARALELQGHCDNLEVQLRRAEWRQADTTKEKDAAIDKLREDASALKSRWDAQIAQLSKEMVSKDLQVQSLQEEEVKLKAQLARCQQDIGRYKQQLSLAVEREQSLARDKVQLELAWQRRCEGVEREQYQRTEDLIQGLTAARDQVAAKLQETERVLCGQEVMLKAVTRERDQAVQALGTRGLHPEEEAQMLLRHQEEEISKSFPSTVIQQLQEQNTSLRNVIAQMRKEMETLSDQILPSAQLGGETSQTNQPDPKAAADSAVPEQLEDVLDPSKTTSSCAGVQPSVLASTDTTDGKISFYDQGGRNMQWRKDSLFRGAVPVDGPSTGLALRRLGDRAHLLSFLVAQLRQKVLREPLDMDTIQRELPHELDQVHLEVLQLRKQVAEIEKHLRSAQKEGRDASGRQQPHASDTEAVGGEGPAHGGPAGTEDQEAQPPQALSVPRLQRKLKEAARKILRLRLEKEQLLELGNRLRAELGHLTGKPPHHPLPTPEVQGSGEAPDARLGPLQPRLTTQDSKNAKKECFSERSGKSQARLAQTVCRRDAEPGCTAGPGLRQHRISTVTCRSAPQKENQSPKPRLAQEFQEENGHHTQRSSSPASSSLQDTWKLLDLGSSPSGLTSQDDSPPEHPAPPAAYSLQHPEGSPVAPWAAFAVEGMKMKAQARGKPARHPRAHPAKPKGCQRPPKIRNYNSKD